MQNLAGGGGGGWGRQEVLWEMLNGEIFKSNQSLNCRH